MTEEQPRLTRQMLMGDHLADMIARITPHIRVLSENERRQSLHSLLAHRPEQGAGVWLFAYGSLLWNPTIHIIARRPARLAGWHRAFCLATRVGRGTPENPGLLLGLREGGACDGAVLRVAEEGLEDELDLLWRREMITAGYLPRWLAVSDPASGEEIGHAIAFTIDPAGPGYAGDVAEEEMVRRLATARGELGTSAEYLFRTWQGLRRMGIHDPLIERAAELVSALLAQASPSTLS